MKSLDFVILVILPSLLSAQQVTNIRAQQEGREIAVYYDLTERANVTLGVKVDGERVKPQLLSGDLGRHIEAGERKRIAWQVLDEKNGKFKSTDVVFSVRANAPWRAFVLAEGAIASKPFQYSVGLMAGAVSRVGAYAKARSSFQFGSPEGFIRRDNDNYYISTKDASHNAAEMPYLMSGKSKIMHYVVDAGIIVRVANKQDYKWYVYAGAGYGERRLLLQSNDGKWLRYEPTSYKGVSIDVGVMMAYKHFIMTLGVNMIVPKYTEIQIGSGYIFN